MVTMAQRIEQLRTEKGLSRPALSTALGLPKNAAENCAVFGSEDAGADYYRDVHRGGVHKSERDVPQERDVSHHDDDRCKKRQKDKLSKIAFAGGLFIHIQFLLLPFAQGDTAQ